MNVDTLGSNTYCETSLGHCDSRKKVEPIHGRKSNKKSHTHIHTHTENIHGNRYRK